MNSSEERPTENMAASEFRTALDNDDPGEESTTETPLEHLDGEDARRRLRELLGTTKVIFLTTVGPDSFIRSRPITVLELDDEARLWAFVDGRVAWVREIQRNPGQINATVNDEETSTMVSIAGTGTVIRDGVRAERLWSAAASQSFHGPHDLSLRLLCIDTQIVEYWHRPSGASLGFFRRRQPAPNETETGRSLV